MGNAGGGEVGRDGGRGNNRRATQAHRRQPQWLDSVPVGAARGAISHLVGREREDRREGPSFRVQGRVRVARGCTASVAIASMVVHDRHHVVRVHPKISGSRLAVG